MSRPGSSGLMLAVTSAMCFGFSGPLAKSLIDAGLTPLQAVWVRLAGAAFLLLVVTGVFRPTALVVPRHRLRFVVMYSLVGFAAVQAFYYGTVARLPVGIAVLLEYASPVLVLAWVRFVRRVRLPRAAALGALLAVAGAPEPRPGAARAAVEAADGLRVPQTPARRSAPAPARLRPVSDRGRPIPSPDPVPRPASSGVPSTTR